MGTGMATGGGRVQTGITLSILGEDERGKKKFA